MRLCIYGAGAVGGLLAVRLTQAGHDVSVIARGAHLDAIRRDGLVLVSAGERRAVPLRASDRPSDIGVQDAVILAVKAPSAPEAARSMTPLLGPGTAVVTAMNGVPFWYFHALPGPWADRHLTSVDPDGTLWRQIGPRRAVGCVVHTAGAIEAPGVVRHLSGSRFILGEPDGAHTPRLQRIADALSEAGFDVHRSTDIRAGLWLKLWGNLSFNPVSALTHATMDILARDPDSVAVITAMMTEARRVAERLGVTIPIDIAARLRMAAEVGAHKTSMLQDLERGRPMEIDALLGAVVEMARIVDIATPICDAILGLVRQRARVAGCAPETG